MCQDLGIILKTFNNISMAWVPADQNEYPANQNRYICLFFFYNCGNCVIESLPVSGKKFLFI